MGTQNKRISRVVIAINDVGALGGTTVVSETLAGEFLSLGYEVEFLSLHDPECSVPGVKLFNIRPGFHRTIEHPFAADYPGPLGVKFLAKKLFTPIWCLWIKRRFRRHISRYGSETAVVFYKPHILEVWNDLAGSAGQRYLRIYQFHQSPIGIERVFGLDWCGRLIPSVDALVALDEEAAREFSAIYERPVAAIRNPFRSVDVRRKAMEPGSVHKLVCISRLEPEKRIDLLIRCFGTASKRVEDPWKLNIWGDGSTFPQIRGLIADLDLEDQVELKGVTDVPMEEFADGHLTAMVSEFEGGPVTLLEAAAVGVPAVCVNCSTTARELGTACGWLVENSHDGPELEKELTEALVEAMNDSEQRKRKGELAKRYVSQFSASNAVQHWIDFFEAESARKSGRTR